MEGRNIPRRRKRKEYPTASEMEKATHTGRARVAPTGYTSSSAGAVPRTPPPVARTATSGPSKTKRSNAFNENAIANGSTAAAASLASHSGTCSCGAQVAPEPKLAPQVRHSGDAIGKIDAQFGQYKLVLRGRYLHDSCLACGQCARASEAGRDRTVLAAFCPMPLTLGRPELTSDSPRLRKPLRRPTASRQWPSPPT